jgi:hypothetical protein
MGMVGQHTWKYPVPQGFGVKHALNPDPYRGRHGNNGEAYAQGMFFDFFFILIYLGFRVREFYICPRHVFLLLVHVESFELLLLLEGRIFRGKLLWV